MFDAPKRLPPIHGDMLKSTEEHLAKCPECAVTQDGIACPLADTMRAIIALGDTQETLSDVDYNNALSKLKLDAMKNELKALLLVSKM
jgi:hypothetical protein